MSKKFIFIFFPTILLTTGLSLSMEQQVTGKRKREESEEAQTQPRSTTESTQETEKAKKRSKIDEEELIDHLLGLPDELKMKIISMYLISSPHWGNSIYDIDKFIHTRTLAFVNKNFRTLIFDSQLRFFLIEKFVKENPQQAINNLVLAVSSGNIETVQDLIKAGVDVNGIGAISYTLQYSLEFMTPEQIENAPKERIEMGTPLEFAVKREHTGSEIFSNNTASTAEMDENSTIKKVRALLESGANPDLRSIDNPSTPTPLLTILANEAITTTTRDEIALMLLQAGANPASKGFNSNETALAIAITKDYYAIIQYLLDYGANPFVSQNSTLSPFDVAEGQLKQILENHSYSKLLFHSVKNADTPTFLDLLHKFYQKKLPNFNIDAQDENGYTALMMAVNSNLAPFVWYLLKHDADPNIISKRQTALSIAQELTDEKERNKIIGLLKEYGAKE